MFKTPLLKQSVPTTESASADTRTTANSFTQRKTVVKENVELKLVPKDTEDPVNMGKCAQG